MEAQLQRIERERIADGDDDFAIKQELLGLEPTEHLDDFGKVAPKRLARFGGQRDLSAVAARHAAETIPFRLELPAVALGQLGGEPRFHWCRYGRRLRHSQTIVGGLQSFQIVEVKPNRGVDRARKKPPEGGFSVGCGGRI